LFSHLAELRSRQRNLPDEIGPVRQIEADAGQRLVERDHRRAVALDAGPVAKRLRDRLADDVAGVLRRVVEIDVQIALGVQRDVDKAVPRDLLDHVIEKADPSRDLGRADAIEIDPTLDPRFLGVALDRRDPHARSPHAANTPRRRSFIKN
jgi:hypothetical protein